MWKGSLFRFCASAKMVVKKSNISIINCGGYLNFGIRKVYKKLEIEVSVMVQ